MDHTKVNGNHVCAVEDNGIVVKAKIRAVSRVKKIHIKFGIVVIFVMDQNHVQTIRTKSGAAVKVVMEI